MDRSGYARGTLAPRAGMTADSAGARSAAVAHDERHGDVARLGARWARSSRRDRRCAVTRLCGYEPRRHGPRRRRGSRRASAIASDGPRSDGPLHVDAHARERSRRLSHPATESGPNVDMQVAQAIATPQRPRRGPAQQRPPRTDLRGSAHPRRPHRLARAPGREIELHLTGHMERFIWSFNGQKFSEAEPLRFTHGERLRIVLVNDSMMTSPHPSARHVERARGRVRARSWCANTRSPCNPRSA